MSDVMLHGVLKMPPNLWSDCPFDIAQRHGRYVEASKRIEELERQLAEARMDATHWKAQCQKGFNIADIIQQRNTLAEALEGLLNAHQPRPFGGIVDEKERLNAEANQIFEILEATHKARQALAAVKGGSDE